MAGIGQYIKDTRTELRHVAWPTQAQTVVYTVLVALISIIVAAYLGVFDFAFTSGVRTIVGAQPSPIQVETIPVATTTEATPTPSFDVNANTQ